MNTRSFPVPPARASASPSRRWPLVALRGVFAILFGVIAIAWPGVTLASLVLLFSVYMLVDGVSAIVAGVRAGHRHQRWGWFVVEGVLDIAVAALAFFWPGMTVLVFVLMMAAWAFVSGIAMLAAAWHAGRDGGRGWLILGGVISVLWGVLLFVAPAAGALVLTWWLGAYALVFGVAMLMLALHLRRRETA